MEGEAGRRERVINGMGGSPIRGGWGRRGRGSGNENYMSFGERQVEGGRIKVALTNIMVIKRGTITIF